MAYQNLKMLHVLTLGKHLPRLGVVRGPAITPVRLVFEDCIRVGDIVGESWCSRLSGCLDVGSSHFDGANKCYGE